MNISRRAADVDDEHIAPSLFNTGAVSSESNTFKHGHRRRQNHGDKFFDLVEPLGVSDALHEKFADLLARRFHRKLAGCRHDVIDDSNFFAFLLQEVGYFPDGRTVAANDDGHGDGGPRQHPCIVKNRFRVAAVDAAGHESFVSAYVTPPRASTPIRTAGQN